MTSAFFPHNLPLKGLDQYVPGLEFRAVFGFKFSLISLSLLDFAAKSDKFRATDPSKSAYFPLRTETSTTKSIKGIVLAIRAAGAWLGTCKVVKESF